VKIFLTLLFLCFSAPLFSSERFTIFPKIEQELKELTGKMGPVSTSAPLDLHQPPGGIEGITPIYGTIPLEGAIEFRWRGKPILGKKPLLVFVEEGKSPKFFLLSRETKKKKLKREELEIQEGKSYQWYLGRLEKGNKIISQSRVFSFRILSNNELKRLTQELSKSDSDFLEAQVFYNYQMYHDMVNMLESLRKRYTAPEIRKLLFLGYVRLGRHWEAKKYEAKN